MVARAQFPRAVLTVWGEDGIGILKFYLSTGEVIKAILQRRHIKVLKALAIARAADVDLADEEVKGWRSNKWIGEMCVEG